LSFKEGSSSFAAASFGFEVIAPNKPILYFSRRSIVLWGRAFPSLHQKSQPISP
jgi:hypothetical protein